MPLGFAGGGASPYGGLAMTTAEEEERRRQRQLSGGATTAGTGITGQGGAGQTAPGTSYQAPPQPEEPAAPPPGPSTYVAPPTQPGQYTPQPTDQIEIPPPPPPPPPPAPGPAGGGLGPAAPPSAGLAGGGLGLAPGPTPPVAPPLAGPTTGGAGLLGGLATAPGGPTPQFMPGTEVFPTGGPPPPGMGGGGGQPPPAGGFGGGDIEGPPPEGYQPPPTPGLGGLGGLGTQPPPPGTGLGPRGDITGPPGGDLQFADPRGPRLFDDDTTTPIGDIVDEADRRREEERQREEQAVMDEAERVAEEERRRTGDLSGHIEDTWESIYGEEGSFGPTREMMEEQRDEALRQAKESAAARGMLGTGAAEALQTDIMRGFSRDLAKSEQDWRQQQIQNKLSAAGMLFQDSWKNLGHEQQKGLAEFMFELERRRKYGEDYNPNIGDAEMQFIMDLLARGDLSGEEEMLVRNGLRDMYPGMYVTGDMSGWPVPGPDDPAWVIDENGDVWGWNRTDGRWDPHGSTR